MFAHGLLSVHMHGKRELWCLFSHKDISPVRLGSYFYDLSFHLNYFSQGLISPNIVTQGKVRASTYKFGVGHNAVITLPSNYLVFLVTRSF